MKKEQDKGRWSQATSCRSLRPAVLGVFRTFPLGGRFDSLTRSGWSESKKMQGNKGNYTVTSQVDTHEMEVFT